MTDRKSTRLNSSHGYISYAVHRALHSFPTRRSSDLVAVGVAFQQKEWESGEGLSQRGVVELAVDEALIALEEFEAADEVVVVVGGFVVGLGEVGAREDDDRSEEHTSELQSRLHLVCRPPSSTLFPYTTLFRSRRRGCCLSAERVGER